MEVNESILLNSFSKGNPKGINGTDIPPVSAGTNCNEPIFLIPLFSSSLTPIIKSPLTNLPITAILFYNHLYKI